MTVTVAGRGLFAVPLFPRAAVSEGAWPIALPVVTIGGRGHLLGRPPCAVGVISGVGVVSTRGRCHHRGGRRGLIFAMGGVYVGGSVNKVSRCLG
ncbi:hypothetical protein chiPu_0024338 [Chiloscyllium punctatum]|uniref:Uncharacterized protein n=1 Tax=Chiloscyllium punctatum TaxID=137246 RepID=A0A401TCR8_CHIPU|nr:hypothetical protein [Chiloscyllium punctatum]